MQWFMVYRFKLNETMEEGFGRIAGAQFDRAIVQVEATIDTPAAAVHETRKCLKRTRALLRFCRPLFDGDTFKLLNTAIRDIGHQLSEARDLDVLAQISTRLRLEGAITPALETRLRASFAAQRKAIQLVGIEPFHRDEIATSLRSVRARLAASLPATETNDLVTGGMARCLDDCRKAYQLAFDGSDDEAIHDWRKAVQLHWRHMQLVSAAWPDYCQSRAAEARTISGLIGEVRDLSMLIAFARDGQKVHLTPAMGKKLEIALASRCEPLRAEARVRGDRLLAEGTSGLCRRLGSYWSATCELRRLQRAKTG